MRQGPVLSAMGRTAFLAFSQQWRQGAGNGGEPRDYTAVLPPRDPTLVRDYIRLVGGDPAGYSGVLPPHFFPQWGFPLIARTLDTVPYPLSRILNGGCRLEINRPLPAREPLHLVARLQGIDDNGRRAVLHQRLVTGTPSARGAVVASVYGVVPLKKSAEGADKSKERPQVPVHAQEIGYWRLKARAGFDFACVTGDFNPIHWIPLAARASGFKSTILHGFATLARAIEGMNRALWSGDAGRLAVIDVRFTKPLVLPAKVGLYVHDDGVFVGDAPGGPAYLAGTFQTRQGEAQ